MDPVRFDRISKLFAERRLSRRQAIATGVIAGAGALAATQLTSASAQDATPVTEFAEDATPVPEGADTEKVTYLFVQSFQSGSIAPTEGTDGRYTVTLDHGLGQTIYFGDRPSRDVGISPTEQFLAGLGFSETNPPNAALLLESAPGETELAVVELYNPTYDVATHTATYDVQVLERWQDELDLGLSREPADLSAITPSFGAAHLLIDDCAAQDIYCHDKATGVQYGTLGDEFCYNYLLCIPCTPYGHSQPDRCSVRYWWNNYCTSQFSAQCAADGCYADFLGADALCPDPW